MTILILGGTAEARALATILVAEGTEVISSLAGRVSRPALPDGAVRVGGFGGVDGLADYLQATMISAVVDATHPFAAQISAHAAAAAELTDLPLLRLERPGWAAHPQSDQWSWVPDAAAALLAAPTARRPFLTTGRQSLATFLAWADRSAVVRVVDPPEFALPTAWTLITSRGPYEFGGERMIMIEHRVDCLITKDSGGRHTVAKLDAAADLGVRVVIIARPARPADVPTVGQVSIAADWVRSRPSSVERGN